MSAPHPHVATAQALTASPTLLRLKRLGVLLATMALAACATAPTDTANPSSPSPSVAGGFVKPNSNLYVEGIPAIPKAVADRTLAYNSFLGSSFVAWHPKQRAMLISTRPADAPVAQLFLLSSPRAKGIQLTNTRDRIRGATFEPKKGEYLVFESDKGGSEAGQLFRLDIDSKRVTPITGTDQKYSASRWTHHSGEILVASVPLDRNASAGSKARAETTWTLVNPLAPEQTRPVAKLDGTGWSAVAFAPDDKTLVMGRYVSANESQVWLHDMATGTQRKLLPQLDDKPKATYWPVRYSDDGKRLMVRTDRDGEFQELQWYNLATGELSPLTRHIPWDMGASSVSKRAQLLAATANVDGRSELHLFDLQSGKELPTRALPPGSVFAPSFAKVGDELAFTVNGARSPSEIWTLRPASGELERWTRSISPEGVDPDTFQDDQIIRWKSFDGRTISGLMTFPPAAKFPGKRPVVIAIHGGPEGQATSGFKGRTNYYINELGVAVIYPNVRGSSGFGKTFLALDNGYQREDSVKDIGALLDWIATQPNLDASRVLVTGGSYGGYMSLAVSTHYADRIAGAIDTVGISHFVTFLESTETYRRDLRRVEYGDERDPKMREFLHSISPLTNAHKITKPLFVVQGKNDPRVPYTEAEQIVKKAREVGNPMVWYLRAENEGHGFARKDNTDYLFWATIEFMRQTILKP